MVKRFVIAAMAFAALASQIGAQDSTPAKPTGPTLKETSEWIATEGPGLMNYSHQEYIRGQREPDLFAAWVHDIAIDDCRLKWTSVDTMRVRSLMTTMRSNTRTARTLPLKEVDVGGVAIQEASDSTLRVRIPIRASSGNAIESTNLETGAVSPPVSWATAPLRSRNDGGRVVAAIKRAAILCGAPASPF